MATTTQQTNEAAVNAYIAAQVEAHDLVAKVAAYLEGHQDCTSPEKLHWGHVGDIQRVIDQLKDIIAEA